MTNLQNKYISKLVFPQFILKIERGVKQQCQLCKSSYGVFKKQHICKRCFRSVCAQCSPFKVKNYLSNRTIKLNRHCTICNIESVKIQEYIQMNKLSFAKDSDLLYIWSKSLSNRIGAKACRSKSNLKNYINIDNLWSSFNFSFREFVARMVEKSNFNDADLINLISNGVEEIQAYFPERLSEGTYLYLFFLCHADMETAINFTVFLLNLVQKETNSKGIIKKMVQNIGFSEIEVYKIQQFLIENQFFFKTSASINVLPIIASFDIVNSIILNKNMHFLWRGIALIFFQRKQVVLKHLNRMNIITIDLLRNPNVIKFANQHKILQEELIHQDKQLKYINLMKQYKHLQEKNQLLEKNLSQAGDRTKTLNDSIFSQETLRSSHFTNDSLKLKEFNQIVSSKNEEIIKLKIKNETLQQKNAEKDVLLQKLTQENQLFKQQCSTKQKAILQLQQQKANLKNMNSLLIQKMKQLSKLLMDQQQKQINQDKNVEEHNFIDQLRLTYEDQNDLSNQNKQKCIIF